ncbi:hypothetical protein BJF85_12500 [Saccharomonospora sp. CUA-673]|nr:hypothetical protein BJF85_12500 [Saccharomonospora sp. CUA-673]
MFGVAGTAGAVPAPAAPAPAPAAPADPPGPQTQCALSDPVLDEVSGLVADDDRWYAVNDGGDDLRLYELDHGCGLRDVLVDPAVPYDVEDLGRTADGTFWLADIGDNRGARDTVAMHELRPGEPSTLYRLTYPDGAHDAEALLLDRDGTPHIVTKSFTGRSGIYRPAETMRSPGPTPLERVGDVQMRPTGTPGGPVGAMGALLITGGAVSHDGRVIALRTYTDAYLYAVPDDGDLVRALTGAAPGGEPVRVPLPDEPQGEAIAFQPDGTLVSMSEGVGTDVRVVPRATSLVTDAERAEPSSETASPGPSGPAHENTGSDGAVPDEGAEPDDAAGLGAGTWAALAAAIGVAAAATVGLVRRRRT